MSALSTFYPENLSHALAEFQKFVSFIDEETRELWVRPRERGISLARRGANRILPKPSANCKETGKGYTYELYVPGYDKKDLTIKIGEGNVEINGKGKIGTEKEKDTYFFQEYRQVEFVRKFTLPENVRQDSVKAKFDNGVLYLFFEKASPGPASMKLVEIE